MYRKVNIKYNISAVYDFMKVNTYIGVLAAYAWKGKGFRMGILIFSITKCNTVCDPVKEIPLSIGHTLSKMKN